LWDKIESEREDCLFVYLTHDVDFAASRVSATKICLKSFTGEIWDWYVVPDDTEIPEDILLEIAGSRKPVIFIEGDKSSQDYRQSRAGHFFGAVGFPHSEPAWLMRQINESVKKTAEWYRTPSGSEGMLPRKLSP
jgi:hypothetical protein